MSLARIKEVIGDLWGRVSTLLLTLGIAVLPALQMIDPTMLADNPWLKYVVIGISVLVAALRVIAPPPPSVPIKPDDSVVVDHATNTVTVTKAEPMPGAAAAAKLAGEKV